MLWGIPGIVRRWASEEPRARDAALPVLVGLALRVATVIWAAGRFPPIEDGRFYHTLGARLAAGHGYTWLWPDGVVTNVAHYPVGYPALLAGGYWLLGARPWIGMTLNALFGTLAVLAVHRIAARGASRLGASFAAFAVALHPGLVLYTPALMTEGLTAALLALAGWAAIAATAARGRPRLGLVAAVGVVLGLTALVRGQALLFAPLFGAVAALGRDSSWRKIIGASALSTAVAVACVVPWTARNCVKMDRCVAVSANFGWNLLIGSVPEATGTFVPITGQTVPPACRTVFGEADKDACFLAAGAQRIAEQPGRWLALVPAKLSYTFDYCGAAGWYLEASNGSAFDARDKLALGVAETLWQRALLGLGLAGLALSVGPRRRARVVLGLGSGALLLGPHAWLSYLGLAATALLGGKAERPAAFLVAFAVLGTALTHAVFFGAGRYSLPVFALTAVLAGFAFGRRQAPF